VSSDRFVVLGIAHVRSPWFRELSRWATSAAVPLDFVMCMSVDELRTRLDSGRPFSALLADAGVPGIDRDLVEHARMLGCAVILVDDGARRDGPVLGVSALLPPSFDRELLIATLDEHSRAVGSTAADHRTTSAAPTFEAPGWRGSLIAVTGAGGTGTSTAAMAIAQGLAADVRNRGRVLLADLALDADQAMLHDARDIVPGVQELVEAFRHGTPSAAEIHNLTFGDGYPYRLLLGLRRHRDWAALRPRAWNAALDGLRRAFTQVVADIDSDLEGEKECGSLDVEERNLLARSVTAAADVVVVTADPSLQGVHHLVRLLAALVEHGVPTQRIQPVIGRGPRSGRARAQIAHTVVDLLRPQLGPYVEQLASPVFVADNRKIDQALRDGVGIPAAMSQPLTAAVQAAQARASTLPAPAVAADTPAPVTPGSLGHWAPGQEALG
jgi:hypothetical protein